MEMTKELLEQLRTAKSVEDLASMAKEQGFALQPKEAKELFEKLSQAKSELTDDMLNDVAGGVGISGSWVTSSARARKGQGGSLDF